MSRANITTSLARASLPLADGAGFPVRLSELEGLIAEYTAPGAAVVKDIARA